MRAGFFGVFVLAACTSPAPPEKAELWIGGDVHLGLSAPSGRIDAIAALFPGAIGVVNLEGPVGTASAAAKLVNGAASLEELARARVKVAGIANNHRLDFGLEGVATTRAALGARGIAAASEEPVFLELAGGRVAITAHDLPSSAPIVAPLADLWIATFHVTGPALYLPPAELKAAVNEVLSKGAAAVVAHGTHVLGPIERRGDRVIAWGLGNLLFNCDCTREREGLVLHLVLEDRRVSSAAVVAIQAGLDGEAARVSREFELLRAIGSSSFVVEGDFARF